MQPMKAKTYAPKGQTPVLKNGCKYSHISIISAISPEGDFYYNLQEVAYTTETVILFLIQLLEETGRKLLIIWDGAKIHKGEKMKEFLNQDEIKDRIHLVQQPGYSPEVNPDEQVWGALKKKMKNCLYKTKKELKQKAIHNLELFKDAKESVKAFFRHPKVQWV